MNLRSVFLIFALSAAWTRATAATVAAVDPLVRVEGRSVATARHGVKLGYPGVGLHLAVEGPALSLRAESTSDEVDFDVVVDGALIQRIPLPRGAADTPLFAGLTDTVHQVDLVHCTESSNGLVEILTLTTPGRFLAPPAAPARHLLFIGDSFTCGAAAEVRPGLPIDPSKTRRQNGRLSYGWLLSRRLDADVSIIAYAGRGLRRDWQGVPTARGAAEFYEYALADDPSALWPHASLVPDVISVCLGNDFDSGIPDEVEYVRSFTEFVRKLRRDAPNAAIFLLVSPVIRNPEVGAPRRTVLQAYLEAVVHRLADPRVSVVDIGSYPGVPGDWHPDGTAHESVAAKLEPLFRRALESRP